MDAAEAKVQRLERALEAFEGTLGPAVEAIQSELRRVRVTSRLQPVSVRLAQSRSFVERSQEAHCATRSRSCQGGGVVAGCREPSATVGGRTRRTVRHFGNSSGKSRRHFCRRHGAPVAAAGGSVASPVGSTGCVRWWTNASTRATEGPPESDVEEGRAGRRTRLRHCRSTRSRSRSPTFPVTVVDTEVSSRPPDAQFWTASRKCQCGRCATVSGR